MKRLLSFPIALVFVPVLISGAVAAFANVQTEENKSEEQTSRELTERIQKLILQLDADAFQDREEAEKKLIEIGPPARKALEEAARSDSAEVRFRAKRALEKVRSIGNNLQLVEKISRDDLNYVVSTAVSGDGKFLYAAGWQAHTFTVFTRDPETGTLKHLQSLTDPGKMQGSVCLRLSPDGNYAAGTCFRAKSVVLLKRDASTGKLTVLDVVQGQLNDGSELQWPIELTFSPDSKFLYVADPNGSGRGAAGTTGTLLCFRITGNQQLELVEAHSGKDNCFTGSRTLTIHPNGKTIYVPSSTRGMLTVLDRDPRSGKLSVRQILRDENDGITTLNGAHGIVCSADGKFVYVCSGRFQGDQAVSVFQVADDGTLSLVQELVNDQTGLSNCRGANEILVSPDGRHVYVAATVSGYVIDFQRDAKAGNLSDVETIKAVEEEGELGPAGLSTSPDGRFLYAAVEGSNEIVVYRITDRKAALSKE